jgi:hypothetical protein
MWHSLKIVAAVPIRNHGLAAENLWQLDQRLGIRRRYHWLRLSEQPRLRHLRHPASAGRSALRGVAAGL